jgi:hypothetical protein
MPAQPIPRARPGLLAVVIVLWVVVAAVALTGTLIVAFSSTHPAQFKTPLKIYPVSQEIQGQCVAGTPGINVSGACYLVTTGITIKQVADIHVERAKSNGYEVSISLYSGDGRALAHLTKGNVGRDYALVVGGRLVAAPRVDAPITKGRILITGGLTKSGADSIMRQLKA